MSGLRQLIPMIANVGYPPKADFRVICTFLFAGQNAGAGRMGKTMPT
jgi:hypothetical protein